MNTNQKFKIVSFATSSAFDPTLIPPSQQNINNGISTTFGFTGSTGPNGLLGPQGPRGPTGSLGFRGPVGKNGSAGTTGITGIKGIQGSIGATGSYGFIGPTGYNGISGTQGSTGSIGNNGSSGTRGSNGLQGFTGGQSLYLYAATSIIKRQIRNYQLDTPTPVAKGDWNSSGPSYICEIDNTGTGTITCPRGVYEVIWSLSLRTNNDKEQFTKEFINIEIGLAINNTISKANNPIALLSLPLKNTSSSTDFSYLNASGQKIISFDNESNDINLYASVKEAVGTIEQLQLEIIYGQLTVKSINK